MSTHTHTHTHTHTQIHKHTHIPTASAATPSATATASSRGLLLPPRFIPIVLVVVVVLVATLLQRLRLRGLRCATLLALLSGRTRLLAFVTALLLLLPPAVFDDVVVVLEATLRLRLHLRLRRFRCALDGLLFSPHLAGRRVRCHHQLLAPGALPDSGMLGHHQGQEQAHAIAPRLSETLTPPWKTKRNGCAFFESKSFWRPLALTHRGDLERAKRVAGFHQ
jgi:hypothetical protein